MSEDARRILKRTREPVLFTPITFRGVTARNRIMMSPMCQYSAEGGLPDDWHFAHIAARAVGGCGIVCVEATHVTAQGRITPGCLGIWSDDHRDALARLAGVIARNGAVPAIQIGHAGRKASVSRPWEGTQPIPIGDGGWETIAPSPVPQSPDAAPPREMTADDVAAVVSAFRDGARRAREAGFRILEVHAAHGYLIHSFLSLLSNRRADAYGGTPENRARLLMETLDAVREEWPQELPLFVRISAVDFREGGLTLADSVALARMLKARGDVDLVDCSGGGVAHDQAIHPYPGYQVPFAEAIRRETGMATGAVGLISAPQHAEEIVAGGRADLVILGRVLLNDPYWPMRAAKALRATSLPWPVQYERGDIY